jgi:formate dehydrogenase alpha subunit
VDTISLTINGRHIRGQPGSTILEVSRNFGIPIPTLCYDPCLESYGSCRICLVEDEKRGGLLASCVTPIAEGMTIRTDSEKVINARRVVVKLMIASHPESCILCEKGNRCKLRQVAADLGVGLIEYYPMPRYTGTQELNPFILRDISKCILCAKCIRADHELVVEGAIDYIHRGFEAKPATLTDGALETSECTFCGTCVEMCPTGALFEKDKRHCGTSAAQTATTCSFCGCGCSIRLSVTQNQVTGAFPGVNGSINGTTLCVRGHYGNDYINHPKRLRTPMVRKDGELVEASWDEALHVAAQGLTGIKNSKGGQGLALLCGPHITNEESYLTKKFASEVLGTDNLSCTSMIYMDNLINGMIEALGTTDSHRSIENLEHADVVMVIGANPTETAPIVGYGIKRGVRKGTTSLILIDPIKIKLSKHARLWINPKVNTDELLLISLIRSMLAEKGLHKKSSDADSKKIKDIEKRVKKYSITDVEKKTGVSPESLKKAAALFLSAERRALIFGNGIMQQKGGKELIKILCTIGSLAEILTKKKTTIFPLLYQSNALGSYQMGACMQRPEIIFSSIIKGSIKGLWVIGEDPLTSLPFTGDVEKALNSLEFLVISDSFLSGIAKKADVVFPSATFAEKTGTITNMEGRVQRINKAIDCVGDSKPDWLILSLMAERLGSPFSFKAENDITGEITKYISLYSELKLGKDPGRYYSYKLPVEKKKRKPLFVPEKVSVIPATDKNYPYRLIIGSILFQLGSGHQTSHSPRLRKAVGEEYAEINPFDASREGLTQGDTVKLISGTGEKKVKARLDAKIPAGVVFLPRPFIQGSSLMALGEEGDGYKTCNIKIERSS